jgi:hypothetical protein
VYYCFDPVEYMKVMSAEGKFPSGLVEPMWPSTTWMKKRGKRYDRNLSTIDIFNVLEYK